MPWAAAIASLVLGGLFVVLPYMLIENQGYSPTGAGAALPLK